MLPIVKGTVSEFGQRTKKHVSWDNSPNSNDIRLPTVRYETISDFKVDGAQVNLSAGRSPNVANDDVVAVAGIKVFGELKALAFKNLSQNLIWGNNIKIFAIALVLILVSFLLNPNRLIRLQIMDVETYLNLLEESFKPFSGQLPWLDFMKYARWALSIFASLLIAINLPKFIAYLRIKDA